LKPTYGRVSRYGLVAFASSLDTIGPIARWVEDIAILLSVISGYDGLDSTSQAIAVPNYYKKLNANIEGMKIGLPKEYFGEGVSEEVKKSVLNAAKILEENGASLEETSLAYTDYAVPVYYIIATSEASSNLARYDGVGYGLRIAQNNLKELYTKTRESGFGKEVKRRIMLGTFCLQAGYKEEYYLKANKVRRLISSDFANAFEGVDAIVTPTSPFPPFKLGEKIQDPISMWLADVFTVAPNLAGLPAISVPCGFVGDLPIGMQLIGKPFDELTILKLAYALQKAGSQN
jgi:aspartyl-tRNA(Asn)/glutamyl-tRNA(Gln) amidotransferase subunit A